MRKIIALGTVLALTTAFSVPVLAGEVTGKKEGESQNIEIQGKYLDSVNTPDVYSADITWGSMEFTYEKSGDVVWKPENHNYDKSGLTEGWVATTENTIKVTNHSNKSIIAKVEFTKDTAITDNIIAKFNSNEEYIAKGEENKYSEASSFEFTFNPEGKLDSDTISLTKLGVITVSLEQVQVE